MKPLEEQDEEEKENKKDEDLTVPGASYIKLVSLTPRPVLTGMIIFYLCSEIQFGFGQMHVWKGFSL